MKRLWLLMSFTALVVVLSACVILVSPWPIFDATVTTNFRDRDSGVYYICFDQSTVITYEFCFSANLINWRSYLSVTPIGASPYYDFVRELTIHSPGVVRNADRVTYSFTIGARAAPLSAGAEAVAPLAIIPVFGAARLVLEAHASDGATQMWRSAPITIRGACR